MFYILINQIYLKNKIYITEYYITHYIYVSDQKKIFFSSWIFSLDSVRIDRTNVGISIPLIKETILTIDY